MSEKAETCWHLVCITRLCRVSMLKHLDLRTARETYKRLMPDEHPKDYKFPDCERCRYRGLNSVGFGRSYGPNDDWLERVDAIGPEGQELEPWKGVKPRLIDMSYMCQCSKPEEDQETAFDLAIPTIFEARAMAEAARVMNGEGVI